LNPATNRFCGQCGVRLQATPDTDAPEEFWRNPAAHEAKPQEASADLPPEVIDFDNQIPLIADDGTERRIHIPSVLASEVHNHLERDAEMHDQLHHSSETHYEVRAREDAAREPLSAASQEPSRTGVSGPSFLGLSEDHDYDYLLQEDAEPRSHVRRNIALAVLTSAVVLAALQWRSVRDYGVAYIQNGSMQVTPRGKNDVRNPPTVAADNTGRDLGLPPAQAKAGTPKSLESSPNADRTPPAASTQNNASQSKDEQAASSAAAASPRSPATTQPSAMSAPPPDLPRDNSTATSPRGARIMTDTDGSTHFTVRPTSPGADEMSRATHASDSEARAAWLWRAVGKGNPQAPVELARMYETGTGVVQSCDQAEILLRSAAAKGNEQAKLNLQQMHLRGSCSSR
jgi:hypothetical protein